MSATRARIMLGAFRLAKTARLGILLAVGACDTAGTAPAHLDWSRRRADLARTVRELPRVDRQRSSRRTPRRRSPAEHRAATIRLDFFDVTPRRRAGDAAARATIPPSASALGSPLAYVTDQRTTSPRSRTRGGRACPLSRARCCRAGRSRPSRDGRETRSRDRRPSVTSRPTIRRSSGLPATADRTLAFTAVLEDPDGDAALGVIEAGGVAFLMNRAGAFAVRLDASGWPEGPIHPSAVVCDGWTKRTIDLGPVEIRH